MILLKNRIFVQRGREKLSSPGYYYDLLILTIVNYTKTAFRKVKVY